MTTLTLLELANACGASLEGNAALRIRGPASLRDAESDEISFCAHARFRTELDSTRAGAVLVSREMEVQRKDLALLRCNHPSRAFGVLVELFAPPPERPAPGVHASAIVDPTALLGEGVSIGPLCHIASGARIGARTVLRARVEIGADSVVGEDSELFPGVVLYSRVQIGSRCTLHAGSVFGSDGHGFEPSAQGWVKIRQCGTVVVEDDVEVGANCTVDRARFGVTRIGRGTKIDNLVHIGHNVVIGASSMIVAQVGIAGSTRLGSRVVLGGQAGVSGHLELGDGVQVGGGSAVTSSWHEPVELWGYPARPLKETLRGMAFVARGEILTKRVRELEQRLDALTQQAPNSNQESR